VRATLAMLLCGGGLLWAHDLISTKITWSREVSRLVYARCTACHRANGAAFSLETYAAARPWAKAIKEEVLTRRMPPWAAVRGFGDFTGDLSLSQEEINTIAEWVEGGAPEGDPALLPTVPAAAGQGFPAAPAGSAMVVHGDTKAASDTVLLAIEPLADVRGSSRITAVLPDGGMVPLLWVYEYRRSFAHPFVCREPPHLPAGTRIVSAPPIDFTLIRRP
jgi:hypothetical protein